MIRCHVILQILCTARPAVTGSQINREKDVMVKKKEEEMELATTGTKAIVGMEISANICILKSVVTKRNADVLAPVDSSISFKGIIF